MSVVGWLAAIYLTLWLARILYHQCRDTNTRINEHLRDFNRQHPIREPGRGEL